MVDAESVARRLREIDRRLAALRDIEARGPESFLSDASLQAAAERHLQLALQAAIDIAAHILAEDSSSSPESYGAAFSMLAEKGILEKGIAQRLVKGAGLRNILVHAYLDVDPNRVWKSIKSLEDLVHFAAAIDAYLNR